MQGIQDGLEVDCIVLQPHLDLVPAAWAELDMPGSGSQGRDLFQGHPAKEHHRDIERQGQPVHGIQQVSRLLSRVDQRTPMGLNRKLESMERSHLNPGSKRLGGPS